MKKTKNVLNFVLIVFVLLALGGLIAILTKQIVDQNIVKIIVEPIKLEF